MFPDGVDFVAVETILNFTSNGGTKTCTDIMILNDNVEEGNEPDRFFVRLQSTGDIQTSTAGLLVEIQDDDSNLCNIIIIIMAWI